MACAACVALAATGCQTPQQTAAYPAAAYPTHPSAYPAPTMPAPASGMVAVQPSPFGTYAAAPPAAAPATSIAAPSLPAAPAGTNNWTWAASGQSNAPPTIQQYGNQL
ncbi:MAG: translation initiation factor IF-2, partial [Planctomycetaceae bacterium]